jgi:aspartate ammonia-lyase
MKHSLLLVLAAAAFLTACGKEERLEAVRLATALEQKHASLTTANEIEKEFVANAQAWCDGLMTNGAGRGVELDQNAVVSSALAKTAVEVSGHLSQVRQAVYDQSLDSEYPQSIRVGLITQLTSRQRFLQDLRVLLERASPEFTAFKSSNTYKGDSYPLAIGELQALLQSYRPPDDAVATAVTALKTKYKLTENEI